MRMSSENFLVWDPLESDFDGDSVCVIKGIDIEDESSLASFKYRLITACREHYATSPIIIVDEKGLVDNLKGLFRFEVDIILTIGGEEFARTLLIREVWLY